MYHIKNAGKREDESVSLQGRMNEGMGGKESEQPCKVMGWRMYK